MAPFVDQNARNASSDFRLLLPAIASGASLGNERRRELRSELVPFVAPRRLIAAPIAGDCAKLFDRRRRLSRAAVNQIV